MCRRKVTPENGLPFTGNSNDRTKTTQSVTTTVVLSLKGVAGRPYVIFTVS